MLIEMLWSPALKLIRECSASRSSHQVGRPNRLPNGGIEPGARPVSCSTSSREANRRLLMPADFPHRLAGQLAVGRQHDHDELLVGLADQGLGPAGQRRAADGGRLLAGEDRGMAQDVEGN